MILTTPTTMRAESPLHRAKRQERFVTYVIGAVMAVIATVVARALIGVSGESLQDHVRLLSFICAIAQLVVAITTLVLVRNQVSVAVHQMEQAETMSPPDAWSLRK